MTNPDRQMADWMSNVNRQLHALATAPRAPLTDQIIDQQAEILANQARLSETNRILPLVQGGVIPGDNPWLSFGSTVAPSWAHRVVVDIAFIGAQSAAEPHFHWTPRIDGEFLGLIFTLTDINSSDFTARGVVVGQIAPNTAFELTVTGAPFGTGIGDEWDVGLSENNIAFLTFLD